MLARRQPGSTLKPFAYELAFEKRLITPASLLPDARSCPRPSGCISCRTTTRISKGWISARTALGLQLERAGLVKVAAMLLS